MPNILVAGIGTGVGKTVSAAILTLLFEGDYWKPIECGDSDSKTMQKWLDISRIHPPRYLFQAPVSPHHAARLENRSIQLDFDLPPTHRTLIIESVGGIFVPLTSRFTSIDLFKRWNCHWVIVSHHYLGSINHTLLTLQALKQQQVATLGIIFNGVPDPDSETAILEISQLPCLGRLFPEAHIDINTLHRYANKWRPHFQL